MKKSVLAAACFILALLAMVLSAADFWISKPFTEWSEKDARRLIDNSPWAKQLGAGANAMPNNNGGNGRRGNPTMIDPDNAGAGPAGDITDAGAAGGRRGHGGADDVNTQETTTLVIRWQSALPVKQALVRIKYGSEAGTAPSAKKFLETDDNVYVIAVTGLTDAMMRGLPEKIKQDLKERTTLSAKGKENIAPSDVQITRVGRVSDVYFLFPKTTPFTVDDKDIDFAARFPTTFVRQRFHVKDMVVNGKLDL
jgi:hypothetical protein